MDKEIPMLSHETIDEMSQENLLGFAHTSYSQNIYQDGEITKLQQENTAYAITVQNLEAELEAVKKSVSNLVDAQCSDGNWNYDPYMHGMANGLITAQSVISNVEPRFLEAPDIWISDKEDSDSQKPVVHANNLEGKKNA